MITDQGSDEVTLDATLDQVGEDLHRARSDSQRSQGRTPPEIPGYVLREFLGQGTFGEVWAGTSRRTGLEVALKVFTQAPGTDMAYLCQEVERLGKVAEHPHVVTLLDADFQHLPPYFAMRRYRQSLHQWRAGVEKADIARLVEWWKQVTQALQYTHSKGLLHCDLKPSNLLLDDEGRAQLCDFGQAALGRERRGSHLGSLGYMAPEQATQLQEGSASPDVLWDVYALGASFYYLFSRHLPRLSDAALHELGSVAQTADKLSRYRRTLQEQPLVPIRRFCPQLSRDLAELLEACLEVDPRRRPQSAAEILADFERAQLRQPLYCRRPWSVGYRARRYVQRHLVGLLVGGLLLGGGGAAAGQRYLEQRQLQARGDLERGLTALREGRALAGSHYWARSLQVQPGQSAPRWLLKEEPARLQFLARLDQPLNQVGFSPDGNLLFTATESGSQVYDLRTATARGSRLGGPEPRQMGKLATSLLNTYQNYPPAALLLGNQLLTLDRQSRLWNLDTGQQVEAGLPSASEALTSEDGSLLVLRSGDGLFWSDSPRHVQKLEVPAPPGRLALASKARAVLMSDPAGGVWSLQPQRATRLFELQHPLEALAVSADGKTVVACAEKEPFAFWKSGQLIRPVDGHYPVFAAHVSPDGRYAAIACYNGITHLYDLQDLTRPAALLRHRWLTYQVAFSPDSRFVATCSMDGTARVFDCANGRAVSPFLEHLSPVKAVAFRPGPSLDQALDLATACEDGSLRVFRVSLKGQPLPLGAGGRGQQAEYSPDGKVLAIACETLDDRGWVELWSQGKCLSRLTLSGPTRVLKWNGETLVAASGRELVWLNSQGQQLGQHTLGDPVNCLDAARSGQLAVGCRNGEVHLFQGQQPLKHWSLPGEGEATVVRFSPDGKHLASARGNGFQLWEVASQRQLATGSHQSTIRQLSFSSDGRLLASAGQDKCARLWSWDGARLTPALEQPLRHELGVNDVQFSPDARLVLTASADGNARLWDRTTGRPAVSSLRHDSPVWMARFSPDGQALTTCTKRGTTHLWSLQGQPLLAPLEHADFVYTACFSPDGRQLSSVSLDGTLQQRDLTPPESRPVGELLRQVEKRSGLRMVVVQGSCLLQPLSPEEWAGR